MHSCAGPATAAPGGAARGGRLISGCPRRPRMSTEIDAGRDTYLFTHGRQDLEEKAIAALLSRGFARDKIVAARPDKAGEPGDYMAMLWMPPNPDHIKVQRITAVEPAEPVGMIGVWKGVSKDDLFTVPLG